MIIFLVHCSYHLSIIQLPHSTSLEPFLWNNQLFFTLGHLYLPYLRGERNLQKLITLSICGLTFSDLRMEAYEWETMHPVFCNCPTNINPMIATCYNHCFLQGSHQRIVAIQFHLKSLGLWGCSIGTSIAIPSLAILILSTHPHRSHFTNFLPFLCWLRY